jgi:cytochrome c-type biogenesis protein CcmH/NrfF
LCVVAAIVLIGGACPAFAQSAKSTLEDPAQAEMFNRISDGLVCQCGCNMILRVCNHFNCPSAVPMRTSIEEQIRAGKDEETIVAGFVAEYGKVVLATPPASGIDLAAWVMPGFAVLLAGFVVVYFVSDWMKKRRVDENHVVDAVDPGIASRIEDELRGME